MPGKFDPFVTASAALALTALLAWSGCGPKQPGPHRASGDDADALIAAEMSAYQAARPVFDEHCARCHTSSARPSDTRKKALGHLAMDDYPFGGHHAGEVGATIREVLGVDGGEATMPGDDPGAVQGKQLELIVAWTRAFDQAREAGAGYHGERQGHDHGDHHRHDH